MSTNNRIAYIDVIKGISMFMIVFNHVRIFSLDIEPNSSAISVVFVTLMVPLFFFLSGVLCKQMHDAPSLTSTLHLIYKKGIALLVPTVVFFLIYNYTHSDCWTFPGGYWFTLVLFEIFLVVYILRFIFRKFNTNINVLFLTVLSIVLIPIGLIDIPFPNFLCLREFCTDFIYFVFGMLACFHKRVFYRLLQNYVIMTVVILLSGVLFLIQCHAVNLTYTFNGFYGIVWHTNAILSILVLYSFVFKFKYVCSSNRIVVRVIRYAGKHTLDIYMIHYFLLPIIPISVWMPYFSPEGNSIIELLIIGSISSFVILVSLAFSLILRVSPILSYLLLGNKWVK